MSAGDVQFAIVTVQVATQSVNNGTPTFKNPQETSLVTFYSVLSDSNLLRFTSAGQNSIGEIRPGTWLQANSWYFWSQNQNQAENNVRWGTVNSDPVVKTVPLANMGITITSATASTQNTPSPSSTISFPSITSAATLPTLTSTSTPVATSSAKTSGISGGAAAGIAIGCLLGGALIAGFVCWFCWRRRKRSRTGDYEVSSTALVPREKGFATNATSLGSKSPERSPMSDILPLPLEDKAVSGEISKICNSIKNHVQSYYHTDRVSAAFLDLDDIRGIGESLPVSAGTISTLLGNATTRELALRFCIAWVVCSKMLPGTDSTSSLLPPEVAGCFQNIANAPKRSGAHASSLARWRVLTAELAQSSYVRNPFTQSDTRNSSIAAALDTLEHILRPYADSRMDNEQRRRNLEEILKRSALFAFTLFSQPSTWTFDWREEQSVKSGELCIFPALVQLSDETGQRVSPPQPFSEAVVRRLDQ